MLKRKKLVLEAGRFEALVAIQSKLLLIELGDHDKPIWLPSKSSKYSSAEP